MCCAQDDVLNVSGHRLSTAEIESALIQHVGVAETAVVAAPDETSASQSLVSPSASSRDADRGFPLERTAGQAVFAFVTLKPEFDYDPSKEQELQKELTLQVRKTSALPPRVQLPNPTADS